MATTEIVETRGRPGLIENEYQDRIVEGVVLAFERVEDDPPELAQLRACAAGMAAGLRSMGFAIAELMQRDVLLPPQLLVAQSEFAGVSGALGALLMHDLVENHGHRSIVRALRGDLPEGA